MSPVLLADTVGGPLEPGAGDTHVAAAAIRNPSPLRLSDSASFMWPGPASPALVHYPD